MNSGEFRQNLQNREDGIFTELALHVTPERYVKAGTLTSEH
jgi:hypothetical protein